MKKGLIIIGAIIALSIGIGVVKKTRATPERNARFTVGIMQTASHPALDVAREGFVQELGSLLGQDVAYVVRNGEGSITNLHTIAQQLHQDKRIDLVFAIATPAAQAMATVEKEKPIVIAAVTDPHALGIIHSTTNVTGTQDMIDVPEQIAMMTALLPNVRTVGLLYNNGEVNSVALIAKMRTELTDRGIATIDFAINNEADLSVAAQMAFLKTDAVLTPTDNMVASSVSLLASLADKYKKPFIVSDNMLVAQGALAARGVDYAESGKQAAQIAHAVLVEGKKPYELPIERAHSEKIYVNKKKLALLGVTIPDALAHTVIIVE